MKRVTRYLRLLPAVVIVGTGLLAIKGIDIARAAQATTADADAPDNAGLAPAGNGGDPAKPDFANDDGPSASASELDVLTSLTRRRTELDARARALTMRENLLAAGEGRVDQKIGTLKSLQTQIQALLAQRDTAQDDQIKSLIKTYSTMKAKDAARIFDTLSDDVLVPVAKGMKSDILAPVLAAMNADTAQKLTVKLASLLKLPETPPATMCPTAAGTQADAATPPPVADAGAPLQTASLNPPVTLTPPPVVGPPPAVTPPAVTPTPQQTPPPAQVVTPPAQAATPPKPHVPPPVHHTPPPKPQTAALTPPKPAAPATTPPSAPAKPATAAATPPTAPQTTAATPPTTPAPPPATTPPAKPATQASAPPVPLKPTPAPTPAPTGG